MMSKHLFFKAMREDLRHKIWMIVLSFLANLLALPVFLLMYMDDTTFWGTTAACRDMIDTVFCKMLGGAGGIVAVVGALITGLYGFRFVFHKNMVDTWHSMPIRRNMLFAVCWLDGIAVWLVPFLCNLALTAVITAATLAAHARTDMLPEMLFTAARSVLLLIVAFLLVYHLVLAVVMVSGNILNVLVSAAIAGFGVIALYGLRLALYSVHLDTFYFGRINPEPAIYASPLFSALRLIVDCFSGLSLKELGIPLGINAFVAAALGAAAFLLYRRRPSELAEQGIRSRALGAVLRTVAGLTAGLGGWLLFYLIMDSAGWGVFGAVLGTVLSFGAMDVVLRMEFRAFFAHKLHLAAVAAVCLAVCGCFYGDLMGYDTYLPDREDIAEIAVFQTGFTNVGYMGTYGSVMDDRLDHIHFQDADAAYSFLERVTKREKGTAQNGVGSDAVYGENVIIFTTKVALKNGKVYYRNYSVAGSDYDVIGPILTDETYLEKNYFIDGEDAADRYDILNIARGGGRMAEAVVPSDLSPEELRGIVDAYNADIREDPDILFQGGGRLLVQLDLESSEGIVYDPDVKELQPFRVRMEVYDSMEHTIHALADAGLAEYTQEVDPARIDGITLDTGLTYEDVMKWESVEELVEEVRVWYGLPSEKPLDDTAVYGDGYYGEDAYYEDSYYGEDAYYEDSYYGEDGSYKSTGQNLGEAVRLNITDPQEIRELAAYFNYDSYNGPVLFQPGLCGIRASLDGGAQIRTYWIRRGDLPEKYIEKFRQYFIALKQQDI